MSYFGDTLKELRQENGLLQKDIAEELQVSLSMVSLWEKGKNFPEVLKLIELAEFFNVSVDTLLGTGNTAKTPPELPEDVQTMIRLYNSLSPQRKREATVWLKTLNEIDSASDIGNKFRA